ncbi:hypothetical protein ME799_18620 [Lactobacillus delbrueckii]|nr:hypothetical protein ME799_18620 [Lactobacillus delbrueckii]
MGRSLKKSLIKRKRKFGNKMKESHSEINLSGSFLAQTPATLMDFKGQRWPIKSAVNPSAVRFV